jgi:hypothetical protein
MAFNADFIEIFSTDVYDDIAPSVFSFSSITQKGSEKSSKPSIHFKLSELSGQ